MAAKTGADQDLLNLLMVSPPGHVEEKINADLRHKAGLDLASAALFPVE